MIGVPSFPSAQGNLVPFLFEEIRLKESCWISGKPFFTRRAIGEFLEYPHPQKAIDNIVARNPYISDPRWATTLKLRVTDEYPTVDSTLRLRGESTIRVREIEAEVYDPIGLQLIIFESQQPKARLYKIAVAHLVYAYMTGNLRPFKWSGDIQSALTQIASMPSGRKRKALVLDLARDTGKSERSIYLWANKINGGNLSTKAGKPRQRSDKGKTKWPEEKQRALEYAQAHPEEGYKRIYKTLNCSAPYYAFRSWIREMRTYQKKRFSTASS